MTDVSPAPFFDAALAYQKTAAVRAAVALDLFTAIERSGGAPDAVAGHVNASERGVRILCDYLTIIGLLEKMKGQYRLTPSTAAFLTTTSPAWLGGTLEFLAAPEMVSLWLHDPAACVRDGGTAGPGNLAPNHPVWVKFAGAMAPMMAPLAAGLAREVAAWPVPPRRMLDVAAGHGVFGIALARAVPGLEVTAIDWQPVLEIAEANAAAAGVATRYRPLSGSAFEVDWGGEFDLVLLANFLHHFDEATCVRLLERARESLAPGGRVLAIDMVPDEDRVSPPFAAAFSYMMLASTPSGDAYTGSQFAEMARRAGFSECRVRPLAPSPMSLVAFG